MRQDTIEVFVSEGSCRISGLTWAEGLVELPDEAMEIKPGDPSTIYAVRKNRLDISTDGGLSFSSTFGYPIKNRMLIEVSEADPNRLYLLVTNLYDFHSKNQSYNYKSF